MRRMRICAPAVQMCSSGKASPWMRKKPVLNFWKKSLACVSRNRWVVLGVLGIFLLDRLSKVWALERLSQQAVELFPFFHLRYVENTGAAFGMMQNGNFVLIFVMLLANVLAARITMLIGIIGVVAILSIISQRGKPLQSIACN